MHYNPNTNGFSFLQQQQKLFFTFDVDTIITFDCHTFLVYLIRNSYLRITHFQHLTIGQCCSIPDSTLYVIVKTFAEQGLTLNAIFRHDYFVFHVSKNTHGFKTTGLLFRLGLDIRTFMNQNHKNGRLHYDMLVARLLHNTVCFKSSKILTILFKLGINRTDICNHNNYVLEMACEFGNLPIVKLLIQKGKLRYPCKQQCRFMLRKYQWSFGCY